MKHGPRTQTKPPENSKRPLPETFSSFEDSWRAFRAGYESIENDSDLRDAYWCGGVSCMAMNLRFQMELATAAHKRRLLYDELMQYFNAFMERRKS